MRYRKKPVVVEAFKLSDLSKDDTMIIPGWVIPSIGDGTIQPQLDGSAIVLTDSGAVTAQADDWIIRGVKGELYPCSDEVFAATYESVSSEKDG